MAFEAATSIPNTKKPPGGSRKIIIGSIISEVIGKENNVPAPKSSRIAPIKVRVAVKPIPIPKPSKMLGTTEFLEANISARAKIIQFTTISGKNIPSDLSIAGAKAFTNICTTLTKPAIIVIYAGMRTLSGIKLRSNDITALEQTSTIVAAMPIPKPFTAAVVTARVGQVPSTNRKTGFSLMMPFVNMLKFFDFDFVFIKNYPLYLT